MRPHALVVFALLIVASFMVPGGSAQDLGADLDAEEDIDTGIDTGEALPDTEGAAPDLGTGSSDGSGSDPAPADDGSGSDPAPADDGSDSTSNDADDPSKDVAAGDDGPTDEPAADDDPLATELAMGPQAGPDADEEAASYRQQAATPGSDAFVGPVFDDEASDSASDEVVGATAPGASLALGALAVLGAAVCLRRQ